MHPDAFIAPTATLVGDVHVEAHASIWYNAVLRADFGPIVVRTGANVQDGCILHGGADPITEIGAGATIGHLCVVHGCWIGPEALIGNGATIQDGARIGARCLVGAGATVPPNTVVPDGQLVLGPVATARARSPRRPSAGWTPTRPSTRTWPAATAPAPPPPDPPPPPPRPLPPRSALRSRTAVLAPRKPHYGSEVRAGRVGVRERSVTSTILLACYTHCEYGCVMQTSSVLPLAPAPGTVDPDAGDHPPTTRPSTPSAAR